MQCLCTLLLIHRSAYSSTVTFPFCHETVGYVELSDQLLHKHQVIHGDSIHLSLHLVFHRIVSLLNSHIGTVIHAIFFAIDRHFFEIMYRIDVARSQSFNPEQNMLHSSIKLHPTSEIKVYIFLLTVSVITFNHQLFSVLNK